MSYQLTCPKCGKAPGGIASFSMAEDTPYKEVKEIIDSLEEKAKSECKEYFCYYENPKQWNENYTFEL